jgi:hypothetical protein
MPDDGLVDPRQRNISAMFLPTSLLAPMTRLGLQCAWQRTRERVPPDRRTAMARAGDIAALYKHLSFAGVTMITLAEGEISELHVGLKGTMNALFLKDLGKKTWRGLEGRGPPRSLRWWSVLRRRRREGVRRNRRASSRRLRPPQCRAWAALARSPSITCV